MEIRPLRSQIQLKFFLETNFYAEYITQIIYHITYDIFVNIKGKKLAYIYNKRYVSPRYIIQLVFQLLGPSNFLVLLIKMKSFISLFCTQLKFGLNLHLIGLFLVLWCWCCSLNSLQIAPLESKVPAPTALIYSTAEKLVQIKDQI